MVLLSDGRCAWGAGTDCSGTVCLLLVRLAVEDYKEDQVGRENGHATKNGMLLSGRAGTQVGQMSEVCGSPVCVGCKVDDAQVDDELEDLHRCDGALPGNSDLERSQSIVCIHDDMYEEVQSDDDPADRSPAKKLGEAEQCRGPVVVDVEESKGLLLEDEEDSVDEFDVLEHVVINVQVLHSGGPARLCANGCKEAMVIPDGQDLLEEAGQEQATAKTEKNIVKDKR